MIISIFKHTARTFLDIFNAFKEAFPKKPDFLFKDIAGLFDLISDMINNAATDLLSPFTREGAFSRANLSSYDPIQANGATTPITITLNSPIAKVLPIGYQVSGLSTSGTLNTFELTTAGDSGGTDTITAPVTQKKTITDRVIGTIPASAEFIEIPIDGFLNIIKTSISLTIAALTWTRVDNFDDSGSADRHFVLIFQSSGRVRILFGDGVNGEIPPATQEVTATFSVTNGLKGRMDVGEINLNTGGDTDIASVTNLAATDGGNNAESVSSIVRNSQKNARLRNAAFTVEDIELLARKADSSVIKALAIPGVGTASGQIVPSSGGQPSGALITTVTDFVRASTLFGLLPYNIVATDFKAVNIAFEYVVRSGFVASKVEDLLEFAMTIATSARDNMTLEDFDDNGIDSARTNIINVVYPLSGTWGFVQADNDALTKIIESYRSTLDTGVPHRLFGATFEFGSIFIIGESLFDFGVRTFNATDPTGNVVTDNAEQIIDTGTLTPTDIT